MKELLRPLNDNIILIPIPADGKTASGLYRPDTAPEKSQKGTVLECGPDAKSIVKKGDTVIYKRFEGEELTLEGTDYIIIKGENILALCA